MSKIFAMSSCRFSILKAAVEKLYILNQLLFNVIRVRNIIFMRNDEILAAKSLVVSKKKLRLIVIDGFDDFLGHNSRQHRRFKAFAHRQA
jgi:hypothetical protein